MPVVVDLRVFFFCRHMPLCFVAAMIRFRHMPDYAAAAYRRCYYASY